MAAKILKHWMAFAAFGLAALGLDARAQEDPPGRVARLSTPSAGVEWSSQQSPWQAADPNWPLTHGDRLRVGPGNRAELHAGAHALRLQGPAELEITALDEDELRLTLVQGSLNLQVRDRATDERIEIDTQNLALVVDQPGEFRIDAEPGGTTRVLARSGAATLFGENGEAATLAPSQQARYAGRNLSAVDVRGAGPRDGLDQWAADRHALEDRSTSAQYLSREVLGYQELDAHGEWSNHVEYGTVWYPRVSNANWAPYRQGQWRWIAPWGWTWIDDARWGFAPFHYGRWVQVGPRWAWVPGPRGARATYAPALVGFTGTPGPRPPEFGQRRTPGTDWFPLAPGQQWQGSPHPRYQDRVNRGILPPPGGMRPDIPVRSTQRERLPLPGWENNVQEQQRRSAWQREQREQNELQQRHEQMRQQQWLREQQVRQQQRDLQDDQMRRQRQPFEQQPSPLREPHRQHDRFMRDQREMQRPDIPRQEMPRAEVRRPEPQRTDAEQPRRGQQWPPSRNGAAMERRQDDAQPGRRPGQRD